jgi:hypothetical protein
MTYVAVDLMVLDALNDLPIEGALVKVFATNGQDVYGEMVTAQDGKASFLLDDAQRYQARAYRYSTGIRNPIYFDVSADPAVSNVFRINASPLVEPSSNDPRLCMCYGYFRTPSGAAAAGVDIHFITRFRPLLLDGAGVPVERVSVRTDSTGWVQVPLIRFGQFDVLLEGYEDITRTIDIPDSASCNLPNLIFEVVSTVTLSSPISLALGQSLDLFPEVFTSTGRKLSGTAKDVVNWTIEHQDVASMTVQWDRITLYGNTAGTTTLNAARSNLTIVRIPDPPLLTGIPVQVA